MKSTKCAKANFAKQSFFLSNQDQSTSKLNLEDLRSAYDSLKQRLAANNAAYRQLYVHYTAAMQQLDLIQRQPAPSPAYRPAPAVTYPAQYDYDAKNRANEQSLRDSQRLQQTQILRDIELNLSRMR